MYLINGHPFSLIIAVKLLRLGFQQPNLTATCTATIRLQPREALNQAGRGQAVLVRITRIRSASHFSIEALLLP